MKIYLIRHGKTAYNEQQKYLGHTNEGLSKTGRFELNCNSLNIEYDFLICSPLLRCIQTCEILFRKPDEIDNDFKEFNFGIFEGKTYNELKDTCEYKKWIKDIDNYQIPNGDISGEFKSRVINKFNQVKLLNYESIVIVSHGGVIRTVVEYLTNEPFFNINIDYGKGFLIEENCVERIG